MVQNYQIIMIMINARLHNQDFRNIGPDIIPDNSIDLIFTDPPYNEESVPLYGDLAKLAQRVLKPGGSLITFTRQSSLFEINDGSSKTIQVYNISICLLLYIMEILLKCGTKGYGPSGNSYCGISNLKRIKMKRAQQCTAIQATS